MQRYRFIFKSEQAAILRIDGRQIGTIGLSPLVLSCPINDLYFLEVAFSSFDGNYFKKIEFMFKPDDILKEKIAGIKIIRLSSDTFIINFSASKTSLTGVFQPVKQQMFIENNISHVATLYSDGVMFIELECEECIVKKIIDINITNAELSILSLNNHNLIAVGGNYFDKKYLLLTAFNGEDYVKVSEFICDSYKIENNELIIEKTFEDMLQHNKIFHYTLDGTSLKEKTCEKKALKGFNNFTELIPYAFLEAVQAGFEEEALSYLDKSSYNNVEFLQLSNFFGEFDTVLQNTFEKNKLKYPAVVKKTNGSFYNVTYYEFTLNDRLIDNIISK